MLARLAQASDYTVGPRRRDFVEIGAVLYFTFFGVVILKIDFC